MDPRFIDVDIAQEAKQLGITPGYFGDGRNPQLAGTFRSYADTAELIPESQWEALSAALDKDNGGIERLITRIFNQGQEGSCVGNGSTQAVQIVSAKQLGKDKVVQLSPISLYKRIGSSPMSGAMCDDALREICARGILPLDNEENRAKFGDQVMPATGFYEAFPSGWEKTASHFKAHEFLEIRGVQQLVSALFDGHPVVVGRAGHCICYVRPICKGGTLHVKYANSWGQWGDAGGDFKYGFGYDSMGLISSAAQWAFAVRSVVI